MGRFCARSNFCFHIPLLAQNCISSIGKWHPFQIPSLNLHIPFNCCNCTLFKMCINLKPERFSWLFHKMHVRPLGLFMDQNDEILYPFIYHKSRPPPPPPPPLALFISNTFEGGLLEREDLFINLVKTMVSVIHKKLARMQSSKAQGQWLEVLQPRDKNSLDQSIQSFTVIHCNWLIKSIHQWIIIRGRGGGLINLLSLKREGLLEGGA